MDVQKNKSLPKKTDNIQNDWYLFKTSMLKNPQNICGMRNSIQGCQKTLWWNEKVQMALKIEKQCFKTAKIKKTKTKTTKFNTD